MNKENSAVSSKFHRKYNIAQQQGLNLATYVEVGKVELGFGAYDREMSSLEPLSFKVASSTRTWSSMCTMRIRLTQGISILESSLGIKKKR